MDALQLLTSLLVKLYEIFLVDITRSSCTTETKSFVLANFELSTVLL